MDHTNGNDRRPRRRKKQGSPAVLIVVLGLALGAWLLSLGGGVTVTDLAKLQVPDYVDVQIIEVDGHSRRGVELEGIRDIVIHYVGNPGTTARQNLGWYQNPQSTVSSHFLVGLDGEIIQCIPLNEKSSATSERNADTISIEVCHPDDTVKFNDRTYGALVELTAWLVDSCGLEADNVIRHYDATGKECPRYYVRNPEAWEQFRADVAARLD